MTQSRTCYLKGAYKNVSVKRADFNLVSVVRAGFQFPPLASGHLSPRTFVMALLVVILLIATLPASVPFVTHLKFPNPQRRAYYSSLHSKLTLPRHPTSSSINNILSDTEKRIESLNVANSHPSLATPESRREIFANSYVDMGKITTIGFDFDYTLLQYNDDNLLPLIYSMAREKLTSKPFHYPSELLKNLDFDPTFAVRGLAVDLKTGWVCQLSYTHKVAVAYFGREKVTRTRILSEFEGRRAMTPDQRIQRLKPLNDLFSMAECCLVADVIEAFKTGGVDFHAKSVVEDVLKAIKEVHIGGEFHRLVSLEPTKYFKRSPAMRKILQKMVDADKKLLLISNSPYWYVNEGMNYVIGDDWLSFFDTTIVLSGKPTFFREKKRPFREVDTRDGSTLFSKITKIEKGKVYTEGCLAKLLTLMPEIFGGGMGSTDLVETEDGGMLNAPNVLYVGDSLFADLVDAKREFGWTTAAIISELKDEVEFSLDDKAIIVKRSIAFLLHAMRKIQRSNVLGDDSHTSEDARLLDELEHTISVKRDELETLSGNRFGSVFRARHELSHYSASLRRFADLYCASVESFLNYSPDYRFYPRDIRAAPHEVELDSIELDSIV